MGLRDVHKGHRVLVNGASGGVGTFAVQLTRAFGAEVTAVCSPRNVELVRELGADHVIDYTTEDFTKSGQRYDVILDLVGNRTLTDLRRSLTPKGTLILSGGGVSKGGSLFGPMGLIIRGMAVGRFVRQKVVVLVAVPSADNLATLTELIEAGQVVPVLDRTYPLERAADAIRYLEVEHARAKVVLVQEGS
jgi:NADPH:quinone reductase-like Zn-dependent oxidoreductase